jgi:hypothetical protein
MQLKNRINRAEQNLSLDSEMCNCQKEVQFVINPGEILSSPQDIHKPYEPKPDEFRTCEQCGKLEQIMHCTFKIQPAREA